ncbi:phage tail protein [Sphingomonas sp.]|jgi:phage tail-like protein|uniref:phage tail protein n=1 Tax=Sphingomonas sp. TaxID=28214 RepID=UPI003D6CBD93
MAEFSVNTNRFDPYRTFMFQVMVDGSIVAGVSKVGALTRTTEVVTHRPGNTLSHQYVSPGLTKHEPIVLERGVTFDPAFHEWANEVYNPEGLGGVSLRHFRKDIVVTLMNLQGVAVRSYKVFRCWPSAYTALPELSANDNAIAIQSLTLQNEGWELDEAIVETAEF